MEAHAILLRVSPIVITFLDICNHNAIVYGYHRSTDFMYIAIVLGKVLSYQECACSEGCSVEKWARNVLSVVANTVRAALLNDREAVSA